MNWDAFGAIGEWLGAIGVVVTLGFLVAQIRQSTVMMRRAGGDAAQAQFSQYRQALMRDAELARLMSEGLQNPESLGPAERLRVGSALSELAWALYHGWDRQRLGISSIGLRESGDDLGPLITTTIGSPYGRIWWAETRGTLPGGFRAVIDRFLST